MTYKRQGDDITLEMTVGDYEQLLMIVGYALGECSAENTGLFYLWLRFVNQLNTGNPQFTPYQIPEEFTDPANRTH